MTPEQLAEVRGAAGAPGKEWTAAALAAWIAERFGVRLCNRRCGRLVSGARGLVGA